MQYSIKNFLVISLILTPYLTQTSSPFNDEEEQYIHKELAPYRRAGYHPSVIRTIEASLRREQLREQLRRTKPQRIPTDRPSDVVTPMVVREEISQAGMQEEEKEREEDPELRAALAESITSEARDEEERKIRRYQESLRAGGFNIIKILNDAHVILNIAENTPNFPLHRMDTIRQYINNLKHAGPETENLSQFIAEITDNIQQEFEQGKQEAQEETELQNITRSMTDLSAMVYY